MNKNITYLSVTPFFPSNKSFVGSYIFDQLNEIRNQKNYKFIIVKTVSFFSLERDYEYNGFKVFIFKTIDLPFFIFPGIFNFFNKKRFNDFLKKKKIENLRFIHSHVTYPASYLVEDLDCKKIVQHHGLDVLQLLNGRSSWIRNIQRNYLINQSIKHLNKADINVGVSKLVLQKLSDFKQYKPKDEYVLYNGVDTSKFFYSKNHKKNNFFTVGCIANFWKIKDQITLIKSVKFFLDEGEKIKLIFIGTGPTLIDCVNFVRRNNLQNHIKFEKEKKHNELNVFYNQIDLFVLPSYYEALGCVYLEAWATNTPFIAVYGQGISELIPDKKNMLFKKKDYNSLAEKIKYFLENKIEISFNKKLKIQNTIFNFLQHKIFNNND